MTPIMLIVNPRSGKGRAERSLGGIIAAIRQYDYIPTVYLTQRSGHATEYARDCGSDYPLIMCVGGDGTLSEVYEGLMMLPEDNRPAVGYVPMGTANDIASSLGLSKIPEEAAAAAVTGSAAYLDVGRIGDRVFSYISAFGAFTDVPYATPQSSKNALGHLAYMIEGIGRLPAIKPVHVKMEYDKGVIEGDFLFGCVMNTLSVAGLLRLNSEQVGLNDGVFEIVLVKDPKNVIGLSTIAASVLTGTFDDENIFFTHTKKARFIFDEPVAWTRDGEDGGSHQDITAENLHMAVKMMIPGYEPEEGE